MKNHCGLRNNMKTIKIQIPTQTTLTEIGSKLFFGVEEITFNCNFTRHIWIGVTMFDMNVNDFQLTQNSLVGVHHLMDIMEVS